MAFDEQLAARVRTALKGTRGIEEKRMFGGVAFLLRGNMCVGIYKSDLVVRLDASETEAALKRPGIRVFDITGKPMKGWLLASDKAVATPASLKSWVARGVAYARTLPAK